MRGRSAHRLVARSLEPHSLVCEPFKTATVHIIHADGNIGYPAFYDTGGCNNSPDYPTSEEASVVVTPGGGLFSNGVAEGYLYGKTSPSNSKKQKHLTDVYFDQDDLDKLKFRRKCPAFDPPTHYAVHPPEIVNPVDPPCYVTGPGIANQHAYYTVKKRTGCDPSYSNYLNWCFTDSAGYEIDPETGENQCPADYLGFSYPAKSIWHNANLEQPFLSGDFWEDNGTIPERTATLTGKGLIPFCTPIKAYDVLGDLLGQYVGYSHIVFFNNNFYVGGNDRGARTHEDPGNLPLDPDSPLADKPPVQRWKDAHSIDVHFYMVAQPAVGKVLKSPRIGSKRFWKPNQIIGYPWEYSNLGICKPQYLYWLLGGVEDDWGIRVKFNVLNSGGGTEEIVMGMGLVNVYLVP